MNCGREFDAPAREVNRGYGKFCSRGCSAQHQWREHPSKELNCTCGYCGAAFYRMGSKRAASRSGLMFCDRKCKEKAQSLESGLLEISRYGDGGSHYRQIALRVREAKCELCGYNAVPEVLEVHHIDRNRSNNQPGNLQILCPTCHAAEHFRTKTGRFTPRRRGQALPVAGLAQPG